MELTPVTNTAEFKKLLFKNFSNLREENPSFNKFIYEVSLNKNLFIVGGYLRCIANNEIPRDLDLIVNINKNILNEVVENCFETFKRNRLGGYKISLEKIAIDTWSVEDNWAFKNRLVKNTDSDYLNKIAEGTFFNVDSLVFDLHTFQYNFKNYNFCSKNKELDILKRGSKYKKLNPTREANILRALYLREKYQLNFSEQLRAYILEYLEYASQTFNDCALKLCETLRRYQKYQHLISNETIYKFVDNIRMSKKFIKLSNERDLFSANDLD